MSKKSTETPESMVVHYGTLPELMLQILRRKDLSENYKLAFLDRIKPSLLCSGKYTLQITLKEYKEIFKNHF